jgi:hypothetical protein
MDAFINGNPPDHWEGYEYEGPVALCIPLAFIPALIAAATTATKVGLQLSGALTPDSPRPPAATPLTANQNLQQKQLLSSQQPDIQSSLGGGINPGYVEQSMLSSTGLQGDPQATANAQAIIASLFKSTGIAAPGETGFAPSSGSQMTSSGGPGILELLKNVSAPKGGDSVPGGANFVGNEFNSELFKGLRG